jgi:hypothetical protein
MSKKTPLHQRVNRILLDSAFLLLAEGYLKQRSAATVKSEQAKRARKLWKILKIRRARANRDVTLSHSFKHCSKVLPNQNCYQKGRQRSSARYNLAINYAKKAHALLKMK